MVDEDRLREWVEQKLDEGVSEDRIRESLRETGHDPSLVEEVKSPFEQGETEVSGEEDFEFTAEEGGETSVEKEGESQALDSSIGAGSLDEEESFSPSRETDDDAFEKGEEGGHTGFSVPSFSVPELPVWPAVLLLFLVIGASAYIFVPWGSLNISGVPSVVVPSVGLPSASDFSPPQQESTKSGCPDVGVRIESISSGGGKTRAEVLVTRGEAEVVLEIWRGTSIAGSSTALVAGPGSITVDATGDRAVLHPVGCREYSDSVAIG